MIQYIEDGAQMDSLTSILLAVKGTAKEGGHIHCKTGLVSPFTSMMQHPPFALFAAYEEHCRLPLAFEMKVAHVLVFDGLKVNLSTPQEKGVIKSLFDILHVGGDVKLRRYISTIASKPFMQAR